MQRGTPSNGSATGRELEHNVLRIKFLSILMILSRKKSDKRSVRSGSGMKVDISVNFVLARRL